MCALDLSQRRHYRWSVLRRALPALLISLALNASATAATASFGVGLDTDNNAATGCVLATVNGPVSGIEQVATAVIATSASGAAVVRLERQVCNAGTLPAPVVYDNGGWPVGLGNGTGGSSVIESSLPLSMLGAAGAMRAVVVSGDGSGGRDATATFALSVAPATVAPVVPVPLSPWLALPLSLLLLASAAWWRRRHPEQAPLLVLLFFVAGSGLVWAATVLRDGNTGDWTGVAPAVTDATGDAPVNADILAVYTQQDGANLHLRIDADVRRDAVGNQAPVVSAGGDQTVTLPGGATLSGSATDDGLPNPPGVLTTAWSQDSGPVPGAIFANPAQPATTAAFSAPGIYVLRLTAADGALSQSSTVRITVNNGAPQIDPIANRTINAGDRLQVLVDGEGWQCHRCTDLYAGHGPRRREPESRAVDRLGAGGGQPGQHTFTARVTDAAGQSASTTFNVTVVHTNHAPQLAPSRT